MKNESKSLLEAIKNTHFSPQAAFAIIRRLIEAAAACHAAGVGYVPIDGHSVQIATDYSVTIVYDIAAAPVLNSGIDLLNGFTASEVILQGSHFAQETAEVYSVCAVLRALLLGRSMTEQEIKYGAVRRKAEAEYYNRSGLSEKGKKVLQKVFDSGLKLTPQRRLASLAELTIILQQAQSFVLSGSAGFYRRCELPVAAMLSLGRSVGCAVKYPEATPRVSTVHCMVFEESNRLYIYDNAATWGTYVNKRRLPARNNIEIKAGDIVYLGGEEQAFLIRTVNII